MRLLRKGDKERDKKIGKEDEMPRKRVNSRRKRITSVLDTSERSEKETTDPPCVRVTLKKVKLGEVSNSCLGRGKRIEAKMKTSTSELKPGDQTALLYSPPLQER